MARGMTFISRGLAARRFRAAVTGARCLGRSCANIWCPKPWQLWAFPPPARCRPAPPATACCASTGWNRARFWRAPPPAILRVGTVQFFAARGQTDMVARVVDYAIARHDPDLLGQDGRYLAFLQHVGARQARLVAQWMGVGFVHGVMNTDNCTLSGETIDYGPCAFMDSYDPATVFSSIDHAGRYAYGNQPGILMWNMARLAEAFAAAD